MADTPADIGAEKGPSSAPTRRDLQAAEKVSRACDNCSKSKSKCLLRPGSKTCENCRFLDVACTFNRTVKKRGPPKGYVNTLEQRLASLESIVTELRGGHAVASDNSPEDLSLPTPNSNNDYNKNKQQGQEEDLNYQTMNQQRLPMPTKPPAQRVDGSSEKSTVLGYLSIDENMTMRYHGPTSGLYLMTASRVFASPFWQFSNPGFWPHSRNTTFRTEDEIVSAADAILGGILPSIAMQNKLLDAFWAYVHPYLPIVHKETFLFQLSKDRRGIPRQGRSALDQLERRIPQVLLLSMFALSARFVENRGGREDSDPGDEYATKAETLIAQHKQSSINCCLALLMMAYREIGTGGSISWMYVGNAIRMSQDLGLHRDPSVWKNTNCFRNMSIVEIQIRRMIWWGAFVLDRYIAAWQGRPCAIHEDDFDTKLPDDSLHGTRDVPLACFAQVVKLSIIQGRIHREFYSVGSKGPDWSKLHDFENSLNEWEAQIPDFLGIRQGVRLPVPVIVMHSQFWNCKVLLHRPFISHAFNEPQTNNSSLLAATSAAVAIANLLEHFTSSYSASFAPPFFNYYSFTAIIMHLFNRAVYPVLFSPSALTHCKDCCRKMSSIWSSAIRTLHIVEGVDHEIDNILPGSTVMYTAATTGNQPVASASASASRLSSGMTAVLNTETHTGADDQDAANFCFTSWPSPIVDPDWLSLETWRANDADVDEVTML
ncbi:Cutinase transcription factor 1 beta [Talaromyces islandicus]|uniref:Cutinase transcription factor 1 beta n=1 Tax=Talaromyces islandicus TaxID=28573 RepID=A0A0U1LV13_TALIS|nr:Cutinase transcription factor 1 beta [Talaromyces islandicus]